jgi:hypothetical protein
LTDSGSDNSSEVDLIQSGQLNQNERDDELLPEDDGLAELTRSLHDFAQWAFGPSGFPSLRIIAFGDFSYGDRFYLNNVHLCRNSVSAQIGQKAETGRNFRRLAENDRPLWDLLDKYSNLLQACPTDPLFDD